MGVAHWDFENFQGCVRRWSDVRRCQTLSDIVREAGGGIRTRMFAGDSREIREGFARDSHGFAGIRGGFAVDSRRIRVGFADSRRIRMLCYT